MTTKTSDPVAGSRPAKGFVIDNPLSGQNVPKENQDKEVQASEVVMVTVANKGQREKELKKRIQETQATAR